MLHAVHVQDPVPSDDLLLCVVATPLFLEQTHHLDLASKVVFKKNLSLAGPFHVLVLGVVHQAIGQAGKVGVKQEAERQDSLVSRARGEKIWNLWAGRSYLDKFL